MIVRRIKNIMKGNRKLNNPKIGCKMSPCFGDLVDQESAYLLTKQRKLILRKLFEIVGCVYI
jgi:hypothetical protein